MPENYPVAIRRLLRNPKILDGDSSGCGFSILLPIAGLKRHRRTAAKALLAKPLSRPLTTFDLLRPSTVL